MLRLWSQMTSAELQSMDKEHVVAALIVGSCEQHACHLPLGTDTILGEAVVKAAAQKAEGEIVLLPTISYGFSMHHRNFAGTVSLEQAELSAIVETVFTQVYSYGFDRLAVISSHGGNSAALHYALNELGAKKGIKLIFCRYWDFSCDFIQSEWRNSPPGGLGHAGEMETALMMHVASSLVQQDRMVDYQLPKGGNQWFHADMFAKNSVVMYNDFNSYSPYGNVGIAQYATAERGKVLFDFLSGRLAEFLDGFWSDNPYIKHT